ncbi:hypothetical protein [Nostoc sp.]|uniref:hypothetical protein n=1 Tax=Nostoc sp. TaxID=1180 RepID=UPI002FF9C7AC
MACFWDFQALAPLVAETPGQYSSCPQQELPLLLNWVLGYHFVQILWSVMERTSIFAVA